MADAVEVLFIWGIGVRYPEFRDSIPKDRSFDLYSTYLEQEYACLLLQANVRTVFRLFSHTRVELRVGIRALHY